MESLPQLVIGQVLRISGYGIALVLIAVVLNVISQLFFYSKNEPPVVFHWFPILGSTISYGMDPYRFFLSCRKKVCTCPNGMIDTYKAGSSRPNGDASMEISSLSSSWARRPLCILGRMETSSSLMES